MKNGKLPENILLRSVIKPVHKTKTGRFLTSAGIGEDCAVFMSEEGQNAVFATGSAVLMYPKMAAFTFHGVVNSLAAGGAKPTGALIHLVMPTSASERDLKDIMNELIACAKDLSIDLAGGHTQTSKGVEKPLLMITVTGEQKKDAETYKVSPGDALLVTKAIGLGGTLLLAGNERDTLLNRYSAEFIEEVFLWEKDLSVVPEARVAAKCGNVQMHDLSHGGIFTAIWELSERVGLGVDVDLKKLPIRQLSVEVCDYLEVNPYELIGTGSLLIACKDPVTIQSQLEKEGTPCAIVGTFTESAGKVLINGEEKRYLEPFRGDNVVL